MASIQKRGEVYRVRITRKGYTTLSKTFANRQEALRWARNTETQIDDGHIKPLGVPGIRTVEDTAFGVACEHYERTHSRIKKNHRSEPLILKALRCWLGERAIRTIDQTEIANLRDELLSKGRRGEILNLQWKDIDHKQCRIHRWMISRQCCLPSNFINLNPAGLSRSDVSSSWEEVTAIKGKKSAEVHYLADLSNVVRLFDRKVALRGPPPKGS